MVIKDDKKERIMKLFLRAIKGENISVKKLADEYNVSIRSVTRDINDLKIFLADNRDVLGNAELEYSSSTHSYSLRMDNLFTNKELIAVAKIIIESRAFSKDELLEIISKMKKNTTQSDRMKLETLIRKEVYQYIEVNRDCKSVIDYVWELTTHIQNKSMITIDYYKSDRKNVKYKLKPVSIIFSEYYFYLIAYKNEDKGNATQYFRIDRIFDIIVHQENFKLNANQEFDEGMLRKRSLYMLPGKLRKIKFEFTGPSVQAVCDKIPTAKIVDKRNGVYYIEAEVYGDGIKMFLLSQGSWVRVTEPKELFKEMKDEIEKMQLFYS